MDSRTIFELRKESQNLSGIEKLNKLNSALSVARNLYSEEPYDEWIQKAFAWVLIDLCKFYVAERNLHQAGICFNELNSIDFQGYEDDIIENQKNFLRPKIDTNYSEVQRAEELSKNGSNKEALAIFKNLIAQNRLTELHHESYGWVIYRYIKAEESNLSSVEVRTFFRDYMNLKNERPSMLHSMILNFALNYSKTHSDFKFYNFFLLWNPDNLRNEDLHDGYKDGKDIPSLISRICREFVNSNTKINIDEFLSKINLNKETVLDFFRETIFWNVFNAHKENKFSELWNLFEQYNNNYSKHGQSKWHSEILNLAERFMKENDEWHFLNFFKNWNPENLRTDDWKETKKDEHTYKPLATKALKKTFEILKTQTSEQDFSWLIKPYETAIKLFPDDEWLLREKALLHFKNKELEFAIKIYKQLVLELSNKHYVWQEFSDCIISDNSLKIGMLSKALSLEKNEDFLGDIHLDLAKTLIDENLLENALVELETYKKHREIKGWKLSSLFDELHKKTSSIKQSLKDNRELYKKYIPFAENFSYADLNDAIAIVEYINKEKNIIHAITTENKEVFFPQIKPELQIGDFVTAKSYIKKIKDENRIELRQIQKIDKSSVISKFQTQIAIVDGVNEQKQLFHFVISPKLQGIVKFTETSLRPSEGDFVKLTFATKTDKDKKLRVKILSIELTEEVNPNLRKDITGLLEVKYKDNNYDDFEEEYDFCNGYSSDKKWLEAISKKYIYKNNEAPQQEILNRIFSMTKSIINNESYYSEISQDERNEIKNEPIEKEITDEMFDKNGKLLLDKLYPELYEKQEINLDIEAQNEDFLYEIALSIVADNEELKNNLIKKPIKRNPDFAFIGDYYVSKHILDKLNITDDCKVKARVIYGEDKMKRPQWKVIKVEKCMPD